MSIFEDKTLMPEKVAKAAEQDMYGYPVSPSYEPPPASPDPIRTTMTPDEARLENRANYPRWAGMDVRNVMRPRRGFGY